jgi:hypothetical protein
LENVDDSSGMLRHVVWQKFTNVSEMLAASFISITLMMEVQAPLKCW